MFREAEMKVAGMIGYLRAKPDADTVICLCHGRYYGTVDEMVKDHKHEAV